jgi:hypothetical protein
MPHFCFGRLGPVLDLGEQLGFDPDALVRKVLGVGQRPSDQRLQALLEFGRRDLVEAMVDLAGVDEVVAPSPAEVNAVPFALVERKARDCQRLPLRAGLLDPVVAAPAGINAVANLRNDAFQADLAGVREHRGALDLEAFAELDFDQEEGQLPSFAPRRREGWVEVPKQEPRQGIVEQVEGRARSN